MASGEGVNGGVMETILERQTASGLWPYLGATRVGSILGIEGPLEFLSD